MSEWISVDDRMPAPGGYYIASDGKFVNPLRYSANEYAKTARGREPRWEWMFGHVFHAKVTHWMPMPPPPAIGERQQSSEPSAPPVPASDSDSTEK